MTNSECMPLAPAVLRKAFGRFPSGVAAVCAEVDGFPVGMVVSSFTSVSLDPPLVSICVAKTSSTWPSLRGAGKFGVNVLSAGQDIQCRQLSSKQGDRFAGVEWSLSEGGALILSGTAAWLECSLHGEFDAGDHTIVLLHVDRLGFEPEIAPLVFHDSTFHRLATAKAVLENA